LIIRRKAFRQTKSSLEFSFATGTDFASDTKGLKKIEILQF